MANELSNLHPAKGERRDRTRVGRGEGSGKGKTAGRGTKGAQSRSGWTRRAGFEGGQMPLHRRLPKKGFRNLFAKDYSTVNVGRLGGIEAGTVVDAEKLKEIGLVSRIGKDGVKVLGNGDLGVALHVRVSKLTKTAAEKILAAGGTIEDAVAESS
jgi:large subunit ribosomal protein L15